MSSETSSSIFLLAAAAFLVVVSFTIVLALFMPEHRSRIVGFLLEGGADDKGKPSLSRLQMLIWNIVIAFGFLFVLANVRTGGNLDATQAGVLNTALDALLRPEILVLLGVSNLTYLAGKMTRQSGAPEDQSVPSGDASKPAGNIPAGPAPMG